VLAERFGKVGNRVVETMQAQVDNAEEVQCAPFDMTPGFAAYVASRDIDLHLSCTGHLAKCPELGLAGADVLFGAVIPATLSGSMAALAASYTGKAVRRKVRADGNRASART
jgi:hypothetical protein